MTNVSWHRALVRHWNEGVATIPGWPKLKLTEPPYATPFTGPSWEDFPSGLRDDIDAYCERLGKRHKTYSGKVFPPCKQSTIDMRRRELVAAVRAAVAAGLSLEVGRHLSKRCRQVAFLIRPEILCFLDRSDRVRPGRLSNQFAHFIYALENAHWEVYSFPGNALGCPSLDNTSFWEDVPEVLSTNIPYKFPNVVYQGWFDLSFFLIT
jgi:hypothetical protein